MTVIALIIMLCDWSVLVTWSRVVRVYICVQFAESSRSFAKYISISFSAINGLISLVSKETVVPSGCGSGTKNSCQTS